MIETTTVHIANQTRRLACLRRLEQDIKNLLGEARSMSESKQIDAEDGAELIKELLDCGEAAQAARYPYSAHCLKEAASLVERLLRAAKGNKKVAGGWP